MLPVAAIRDRLAARLPLPGSGPRDLPARQRTLEDAIGWSIELLDQPARQLFDRTGVFAGSFDLAQAEIVCSAGNDGTDVLDGLARLSEHSLIGTATGAGDTGIRFRTLETIRTAALTRLRATGDEIERRTRHAQAYLELAERAAPEMPGREQSRWIDRLTPDNANLRAAILWAVERGDAPTALRLVAHLWRYWLLSGRLHEGRELVDLVFAMPGANEPTPERVRALDAAGGMAYWHADTERADRLYAEQVRLAEELGLQWELANATFNAAHSHFARGDPAAAAVAMDRARSLAQAAGDDRTVLRIEWTLAAATQHAGRIEEASKRFEELASKFEATGDVWYQGMAMGSVAWSSIALGDMRRAAAFNLESFRIAHDMRDVADSTISLQIGAVIALGFDRARDAARMLGAFEALCQLYGVRPPAGLAVLRDSVGDPWARTLAALGRAEYDAAFAEGERMTLDDAVAFQLDVSREILAS
jgi:non-specific serine/threonine protein kinase